MKKEYRIKKTQEFQSVIEKRQSVGCSTLVIYYQKNNLGYTRVGISSGKKVGNAVIRNRTKRQVRSILVDLLDFNKSIDYIVIVRNKFLEQSFENKNRDFKYLLEKINKKLNKEN